MRWMTTPWGAKMRIEMRHTSYYIVGGYVSQSATNQKFSFVIASVSSTIAVFRPKGLLNRFMPKSRIKGLFPSPL
jgi:hypothetical protein